MQCVAMGVCCMWFLNNGVFAQVHGEVANEPMLACAAGGRWAFRRRRASICNALRLLAGLWGLHLNAALLLSRGRILRGALRMTSLWRRTRINFHSAALHSP